jgi:hypothetical protein
MPTISFNGRTYNSLEEMPADQRAAYEQVMAFMKDENHNGIPDVFEGDAIQKMLKLAVNTRVVVNGQEVRSLESLPPETRAKFDQAMQKLGQLGIFPPGVQGMQQGSSFQSAPQISTSEPAFVQSPSAIQSTPSVISEDKGSRTVIVVAVMLGVLFLCLLLVAVRFLFLTN